MAVAISMSVAVVAIIDGCIIVLMMLMRAKPRDIITVYGYVPDYVR